jgi:hypothetical protein
MEHSKMRQKSYRVTRFLITQFIALMGWIIVQSFFSLSAAGQHLPFLVTVIIEAIWWIALLAIMLRLFLSEYNRFVQAAVDLEEANSRLRNATNQLLQHMKNNQPKEDHAEPSKQDAERS